VSEKLVNEKTYKEVLKFTIKELDIEKTEKLLVDFLERVYA